jgi:hypothetical protein
MIDCISSLFSQYQLAVSNASAKLPVLTGNMIIINTYIQLYSISIECGDTDKATQYLEQLQEYMNLIGCDCSCNDCGNSSEPTEVFPLFTEPMPNYVPISYLEANNITIDSNTKVPTNKAVITYVNGLLENYYTETQIDTILEDYYTETEVDTILEQEEITTESVFIEDSIENRENLRTALKKAGIGDFENISTMQFIPGWTDITLNFNLRLDIMTSVKGLENSTFEQLLDKAYITEINDVPVYFLDYENLIKAKKAANRLKDILDIEELEKINKKSNS